MEEDKMITIRKIAALANVSRSTVSRVLNESGYVNEDTRKKVLEVIKETGYIPSEQAKSFRTKKTKVIGVIIPTIQTETSSKIVSGIDQELSKNGFQILLANTNLDRSREIEFLELLTARRVEGIILIGTNTSPVLVKNIHRIGLPVVVIGQEIEGVTSVLFDDYHAARDIIRHILSKGHQKIGLIGVSEEDTSVGFQRLHGYLDELEANKIKGEKHWIQQGIFDINSGFEAMKKILQGSNQQPTAVFAVTDRLAFGALKYLKTQNFRIPEDFAIVSIGASEMTEHIEPQITTIDYDRISAGKTAAQELLALIQDKDRPNNHIILPYTLIQRESV